MENAVYTFGFISVAIYIISLCVQYYSVVPLMLLGGSGLGLAVYGNQKTKCLLPLAVPMAAFVGSIIVSILVSADMERSFLLTLSIIPAVLLYYLIPHCFDPDKIWILFTSLSCAGLIISLTALWYVWGNRADNAQSLITRMANPNLIVPNDLIIIALTIPFSVAMAMNATNIPVKLFFVLIILLNMTTITLYQSRGGLIIAFLLMLGMIILMKAWYLIAVIAAGVVLSFLADSFFGFPFVSKFLGSWDSRILYWLVAWAMFLDAPWFGHGPRTFGSLYLEYRSKIDIPDWLMVDPRHSAWVHNLYLETLCEQGIAGAACLIVLIGTALYFAWLNYKNTSGKVHVMCASVLAVFSGFVLAGGFELTFLRRWVVIFYFTLMGIITTFSCHTHKAKGGRSYEIC